MVESEQHPYGMKDLIFQHELKRFNSRGQAVDETREVETTLGDVRVGEEFHFSGAMFPRNHWFVLVDTNGVNDVPWARGARVLVRRPVEDTIQRGSLTRGMEVKFTPNSRSSRTDGLLLFLGQGGFAGGGVKVSFQDAEEVMPLTEITFARWPNELVWRKVVDDTPATCPTCGKG
jgi:hypothetical protein